MSMFDQLLGFEDANKGLGRGTRPDPRQDVQPAGTVYACGINKSVDLMTFVGSVERRYAFDVRRFAAVHVPTARVITGFADVECEDIGLLILCKAVYATMTLRMADTNDWDARALYLARKLACSKDDGSRTRVGYWRGVVAELDRVRFELGLINPDIADEAIKAPSFLRHRECVRWRMGVREDYWHRFPADRPDGFGREDFGNVGG